MSVDQNTVRKIAHLARIRVGEEALPRLETELNSILKWIEMLNEVNTDGVEPLTSVVAMHMKMRDDVVSDGQIATTVTANAPRADDSFFMVPKVVE
jgi:aspartyl-tRNA(Asn)/glutamyl-tRNA(Gln) amidotransferase subunit C